uniref:Thioredoxin domain-containing protein n=1 Tax=Timema tahoe TaxID=61484 RepID=A0A7R9IP06_9NEOP|nr:unnamed protein product [Timema tahoe]
MKSAVSTFKCDPCIKRAKASFGDDTITQSISASVLPEWPQKPLQVKKSFEVLLKAPSSADREAVTIYLLNFFISMVYDLSTQYVVQSPAGSQSASAGIDDGFTVVSRRKNNSVNSNVREDPPVQHSPLTSSIYIYYSLDVPAGRSGVLHGQLELLVRTNDVQGSHGQHSLLIVLTVLVNHVKKDRQLSFLIADDRILTLTQSVCDLSLSQECAMTLTPLFLNSWSWTAILPSSVVQTGVKSAGWEKSTAQLSDSAIRPVIVTPGNNLATDTLDSREDIGAHLSLSQSVKSKLCDETTTHQGQKLLLPATAVRMRLGATIPNFTDETTQGRIKFYDWLGDSWSVLFSHPADFTPVCTTELGRIAVHDHEFKKRGVKVIAHSCDKLRSHTDWVNDIKSYCLDIPGDFP